MSSSGVTKPASTARPKFDTEHLLLGLLREDKALHRWLPKTDPETGRRVDDEHSPERPSISAKVDLPLSAAAKRVLKLAADEAARLAHRHIGTEHLFLGLLDEGEGFAAQLLREGVADADGIRIQLTASRVKQSMHGIYESIRTRSWLSLGRRHRNPWRPAQCRPYPRRSAEDLKIPSTYCTDKKSTLRKLRVHE